MKKSKQHKKVAVNTRLPEDVIQRWHIFAAQVKETKENALAMLIDKGTIPIKK
jgi:hypothetical protein